MFLVHLLLFQLLPQLEEEEEEMVVPQVVLAEERVIEMQEEKVIHHQYHHLKDNQVEEQLQGEFQVLLKEDLAAVELLQQAPHHLQDHLVLLEQVDQELLLL